MCSPKGSYTDKGVRGLWFCARLYKDARGHVQPAPDHASLAATHNPYTDAQAQHGFADGRHVVSESHPLSPTILFEVSEYRLASPLFLSRTSNISKLIEGRKYTENPSNLDVPEHGRSFCLRSREGIVSIRAAWFQQPVTADVVWSVCGYGL